MSRKDYLKNKKIFATMRKRAKKPEILEPVLQMARNGATYMEIYNALRIPDAPDIPQPNITAYVMSICLPAAKIKKRLLREKRKCRKAKIHQAVWLAAHGIAVKWLTKLFELGQRDIHRKLHELNGIDYACAWARVTCLKCGRVFWSWDRRQNRICPRCKKLDTIYVEEWGAGRILTEGGAI